MTAVVVVLAVWVAVALPVAVLVGRVLRDGHGPNWKERA
jgi:hypothetical protein